MITRPVGHRALLIEVGTPQEALDLAAEVRGSGLEVEEVVPGARTVLLDGLADLASAASMIASLVGDGPAGEGRPGHAASQVAGLGAGLSGGLGGGPAGADDEVGRGVVELPVTYDGEDLARIAELWGCSVEEVIRRHTSLTFTSAFCGFAPGFAYLAGLPEECWVPRLAEPRVRVPAGSVAIAGPWCGVYPGASPGGWLLLGRTDVTLWDPAAADPALLAPGRRVRFVAREGGRVAPPWVGRPVVRRPGVREPGAGQLGAGQPGIGGPVARRSNADPGGADLGGADPGVAPRPSCGPVLKVIEAGVLVTIQDLGRIGWAHLGVPRAGPLDAPAAALANRLAGNDADAALLEITLGGFAAINRGPGRWAAVTGARAGVTLNVDLDYDSGPGADRGAPSRHGSAAVAAPHAEAFWWPPGAALNLGRPLTGVRTYLAVSGGIDVEPVLGSRSTDTLAWVGSPRIGAGRLLPLGPVAPPRPIDTPPARRAERMRVSFGPRDEWFVAREELLATSWLVRPDSDRVGLRLDGPALARSRAGELPSEGMVAGAIQVPPDGRPIVFLADHPPTGGYPVIGVVHPDDLWQCAQVRPGERVRFRRG